MLHRYFKICYHVYIYLNTLLKQFRIFTNFTIEKGGYVYLNFFECLRQNNPLLQLIVEFVKHQSIVSLTTAQ